MRKLDDLKWFILYSYTLNSQSVFSVNLSQTSQNTIETGRAKIYDLIVTYIMKCLKWIEWLKVKEYRSIKQNSTYFLPHIKLLCAARTLIFSCRTHQLEESKGYSQNTDKMIKGQIIATTSKYHKPNVLLSIPKITEKNQFPSIQSPIPFLSSDILYRNTLTTLLKDDKWFWLWFCEGPLTT